VVHAGEQDPVEAGTLVHALEWLGRESSTADTARGLQWVGASGIGIGIGGGQLRQQKDQEADQERRWGQEEELGREERERQEETMGRKREERCDHEYAAPQDAEVSRSVLMRYMETHRPDKAQRVDIILAKYEGKHWELRQSLKDKYGVDPLDGDAFEVVGGGWHARRTDAPADESTKYRCEKNCGFTGSFTAVAAHELSCDHESPDSPVGGW
jgi:hypothetical protein